jgi:hypothetical protein
MQREVNTTALLYANSTTHAIRQSAFTHLHVDKPDTSTKERVQHHSGHAIWPTQPVTMNWELVRVNRGETAWVHPRRGLHAVDLEELEGFVRAQIARGDVPKEVDEYQRQRAK